MSFVFLGACWAETVTLHLRNGARVTGEMLSLDSTFVTLTNSALGKISIPVAEVQQIEKITLAQGVVTNQLPLHPSAATATNASPAQVAQPTPAAKPSETAGAKKEPVKKARGQSAPVKPEPPKRWNLNVDLGTDLEYNQTDRKLFYGHAKWTYGKDRFRSIVDYLANYGKTDGILAANDMNGSVRVELDVGKSKKVFMFNAAGAGYNEIQHIDLTYDETFGAGYKWFTGKNFVLNSSLGVNYQKKYLADGTAPDYEALDLGEQFTWKINPKWSLDQKFDYYPRYNGFGNYRIRAEANLHYLLSSNLRLNFTAIDQYDSRPAQGVTDNDLLLRATLGITF